MPVGQYDAYSDFIRPAIGIAGIINARRQRELEEQRIGAAIQSQRAADLLAQQKFGLEQDKFGIDKEKIQQEIAASKALTALNVEKLEDAHRTTRQLDEYANEVADRSTEIFQNSLGDFATIHGFPALTPEVTSQLKHQAILDAGVEATTKLPPSLIEPALKSIRDTESREKIADLGYKRALEVEESRDRRVREIAELQDKYKRDALAQRAAQWVAKSEALMGKMKDVDQIAYKEAAQAIRSSQTLTDDEKAARLEVLHDTWAAKLSGQPPPTTEAVPKMPPDVARSFDQLKRLKARGVAKAKLVQDKSGKFSIKSDDWFGNKPLDDIATELNNYLEDQGIPKADFKTGKYKIRVIPPK